MTSPTKEFSFSEACYYLEVSSAHFVALREQGLVISRSDQDRQIYVQSKLDITRYLLALGRERDWSLPTLAWYADLLFASEIGRAILLPIHEQYSPVNLPPVSWLETPHAIAILDDLGKEAERVDTALIPLLRSLVTFAIGEERFWPDVASFRQSALYPIIAQLEETGAAIIGQDASIARDAHNYYALMVLGFGRIAPPISREFAALVRTAQSKMGATSAFHVTPPSEEQGAILKQPLIPIDRIYASKATEIHSPPEAWNFKLGILRAQRRTIAVQIKIPTDSDKPLIDNVLDMIRPYLGQFGARVVHLLYEIANDPPHYRHPVITVDTNEMLDKLGLKRDRRGVHRSKNRERLRDALNAAHALEIVGEFSTREKGKHVRKVFYRTVLSILGATFDAEESATISTVELRERGLPKSLQIRLNFYDGIRQPDGKLGTQFVLVPRLAEPQKLAKANYSATADLLKAYFFFRYRQTQMKSRTLAVARETALEKARITNKHAPRATATLRKALDKLIQDGTLEGYSTPLPTKPRDTFEITLSEDSVYNQPLD